MYVAIISYRHYLDRYVLLYAIWNLPGIFGGGAVDVLLTLDVERGTHSTYIYNNAKRIHHACYDRQASSFLRLHWGVR